MEIGLIELALSVLSIIVIPLAKMVFSQSEAITRLEGRVETNTKAIDKINSETSKEMKEMKELLHQLLVEVTELKTYQKYLNENK